MKNAILVTLLLASTRTVWADRQAALAEIEAREPTLVQVQQAALRHAGLADSVEAAWPRRARWSALLPGLTVKIDGDSSRDHGLSRASSGTERLDMTSDNELGVEAKAVWQLDRLIFSDLELRAVKAARQHHRERVQVLAQVTTLYFQRRKVQMTAVWSPPKSPDKAAMQALAIQELTAQLDLLTGGYFGKTVRLPPRG